MKPLWFLTRDGDPIARALHRRHYSKHVYADGREPKLFVGPGEKVVLRTASGDAVWAWRRFKDDSGQTGVCNALFRNESKHQSSELIRQACAIADCLWPHSRLYSFVDPKKVKSSNPGYCYIKAGWRKWGVTKGGLIVLERPSHDAKAVTTD